MDIDKNEKGRLLQQHTLIHEKVLRCKMLLKRLNAGIRICVCLTRVKLSVGFRLRRGEELHHDWLIAGPVLQPQPAILQKFCPSTI